MDGPHDLSCIPGLTEASALATLKHRYESKKFCTFASSVLLSLSSSEKNCKQELQDYRSQKAGVATAISEPAHLFSFLSKTYRQLTYDNSSHSIIISGEAQAGKTVIADQAILFLNGMKPEIASKWECSQVIIEAITSTPIQDSGISTRQVQLRKVFFDKEGNCTGGSVSLFGLELPRVSILSRTQRNFNIFYYLVEGLDPEEREKYFLTQEEYVYLGFTAEKDSFYYQEKLLNFRTAFRFIVKEQLDYLFKILSGILHLGNIKLTSKNGIVEIKEKSELHICSQLLGVSVEEMKEMFLEKDPNLEACQNVIDEFAMKLYSMLVNWLVSKINVALQNAENFDISQPTIGVLDLYGYNPHNTHQTAAEFITNTANEKLKQLFCENIRKQYSLNLQYNEACTELIQNILTALSAEFQSHSTLDEFYNQLQKLCVTSPFAKLSKEDETTLECNHFFRNITYNLSEVLSYAQFTDSRSIAQISKAVSKICTWMGDCETFLPPLRTSTLFYEGVFDRLTEEFYSATPHFVCCIRPDGDGEKYSNASVLRQLKTHGITRLIGTPSRKARITRSDIPDSLEVSSSHTRARSATCVPNPTFSPGTKRKAQSSSGAVSRFVDKIYKSTPDTSDKAGILGNLRTRKKQLQTSVSQGSESVQEDFDMGAISRFSSDFGGASKSPKLPISARLEKARQRDNNSDTEDDSLCLSSDELTEISELSSEEIISNTKLNDNFVKLRTYSDTTQRPISSRSQSTNPNDFIRSEYRNSGSFSGAKKRAEEFLFLYSCGSLLRTIYKEEDIASSALQMLSPHRVSDASVVSTFHQQIRGRANSTEADSTETPVVLRGRTATDGMVPEKDELLDEWKGLEQAEITPELANWERRSVRLRKHKSILPLLKLESGDAVINQINYHNSIRTTPRRHKSIITFMDVQGVSFQSYAENRFQIPKKMSKLKPTSSKYRAKLKKLISATKTPITAPLHSLRAPLHDIALENFKHILLYMLTKPGANKEVEAMTHIREVVRNGLERSSLRDEIYCQLVKQTFNNLKERCEALMWELMAICTGCFAPSYFLKNLVKYLDEVMENPGEIGAWASYCKDRLLKTAERGKRLFVPVQREILAVQNRKPLIETFHFMDGKQKQIPIYSSTTAEEALEFLLQMIGLRNVVGYMVYESYCITDISKENQEESQTVERSLLASEVICTSLSKFQQFENSFANKPHIRAQTRFVVKRKLFLDSNTDNRMENNILFYQLSETIRLGDLLVSEADALMLGSLWLQISLGDYREGLHIMPKQFIPTNIYPTRPAREWKKEVVPRYQESAGIPREEAVEMYLEYCKQLPFYGYHLFRVVNENQNWKLPADFYLAVHCTGVYFLSQRKEIYYSFQFLDILTHSSTPYAVALGFPNNVSISLKTNKGDEILSLIIDYKYYQLQNAVFSDKDNK